MLFIEEILIKVNKRPYNIVILLLLQANMNIQYATGMQAMLIYLTPYFCKSEHTMAELMKST